LFSLPLSSIKISLELEKMYKGSLMREIINNAVKDAMRSKDKLRLSTLRLVNAAIKDKDIALRTEDRPEGVSSSEILQILGKMVKQRQESAKAYEEGGRLELAQQELSEIKIIEEYLPRQLSDEEVDKAINEAIRSVSASSIRDMGKVMGFLKERYNGQLDFGKAGAIIKKILG